MHNEPSREGIAMNSTLPAQGPVQPTTTGSLLFYPRALLAGLWFLTASLIGIFVVAVHPGDPSNSRRFARIFSWLSLRLVGLRVHVRHREFLSAVRPCVYVTNHQANEDLFIHCSFFPDRTVVTGKRELIRIPLFGVMFKVMGNILLDRDRRVTAVSQLSDAARRIREEKISVWIFPEGHRNKKRELLPFKRGAFHLARLAGVPVVPVVTQRYGHMLDIASRRMKGGVVHVEILEPVPTTNLTEADIPALAATVQKRIEEALDRIDAEIQGADRVE